MHTQPEAAHSARMQPRFPPFAPATLALITVLVAFAAFGALASAQTPGPGDLTPSGAEPAVCPPERPDPAPATRFTAGDIWVFVPAGRSYVLESPSESGFVNICVEGVGGVRLNSDCAEVSRYVDTPNGNAILDGIVASCEPAPTPVPTVGGGSPTGPSGPAAPTPTSPISAGISPPDTGSGGLR